MIEFDLVFDGALASGGLIDAYDATRAITGFQRSLALTTHLVLNGEIITQAPSLRGAQILTSAIEEGSWKTTLKLIIGGTVAIGSVGKDSPVGHLVTSAYDYVLNETMGFHVDYDKTIQQQYQEHLGQKRLTRERLDSLMEKVEPAIADMHRPIVASKTAGRGDLYGGIKGKLGPELSFFTYEYVQQTQRQEDVDEITGVVTSYNTNTYKGRLYSFSEGRPIPFELMEQCRNKRIVGLLTQSQHYNGQDRSDPRAVVTLQAHRLISVNGALKRLHVVNVEPSVAAVVG